MVLNGREKFKNAESLLMIGDLLNYFLTGEKIAEYTAATTTQVYNLNQDRWDGEIINMLGLDENLFPDVLEPGRIIKNINDDVSNETGCGRIPVCLSAYDTSSEIASIPVIDEHLKKNWAYFCCGTWAMAGIVSPEPIIDENGLNYGFGNEGGVAGDYNFLKNIVGLWIIQQCRRKWSEEKGSEIEWDYIVNEANNTEDSDVFIDVNESMFDKEIFDMPGAILEFCRKTNQSAPRTIGEYSRCVYQSLVLALTASIRQLEYITGKKIEVMYMVGGGAKNSVLCQWASDSLGIPVIASPIETTATGNILLQMVANGESRDIAEAKEILINSVKLDYFEPSDSLSWQDKYKKYLKVLKIRRENING
jgi:sugar (pentulose or hexulose) kinase